MGNSQDKPHASITHHLSREMVSRAALRKEFREYAGLCCSTMSRARLIQFGQDMYHTLGVPVFDTSLQAVPDKEYTFEQFEEFFLSLCPSDVPLSVSLRDCQKTETTNRDEIVFQRSCADVRWATLITPENEDEYCVPGQSFHLEWHFIFSQIETRDLNSLNLTCRFFRTVLDKYPPLTWRVACLSSLEQRTALDIGLQMSSIQRMKTIVRLEIGVFNLGNMLSLTDLNLILENLSSLQALKLIYCHLLSDFLTLGTCYPRLQSLTVFQTQLNAENLSSTFPNLTNCIIAGQSKVKISIDESLGLHLMDLRHLTKLGLGDLITSGGPLNLEAISEFPKLSHLYLEGSTTKSDAHFGNPAKPNLFPSGEFSALRELVLSESRVTESTEAFKARVVLIKALDLPFPKICNYSWSIK